MLHKTEGIVLSILRYSDRYAITHVYTADFGATSYLLPVTSNKKAKIKNSLFFPFSLLRMEVEHLPKRDIQKLKEGERLIPLYEICTDMSKLSLAFFLSEFLYRVLRESDNNEITFKYIKNSVETLEAANSSIANFHIAFMIGLTRFLGIYPNWENTNRDNISICLMGSLDKIFHHIHIILNRMKVGM